MIDAPTGESQTSLDIRRLQVGQFTNDLLGAEAVGQKVEHIAYAYAHPADTRPSAALLWINGNPICQTH
jgi:hypothetical protein